MKYHNFQEQLNQNVRTNCAVVSFYSCCILHSQSSDFLNIIILLVHLIVVCVYDSSYINHLTLLYLASSNIGSSKTIWIDWRHCACRTIYSFVDSKHSTRPRIINEQPHHLATYPAYSSMGK